MNKIRFVFALAALLLWGPLWSQTANRSALRFVARARACALLAELLKGGYVLYFRHAATDFSENDERMKSYEDCANQRNLIDKGRGRRASVGAAIRRARIPVRARSRQSVLPHRGTAQLPLRARGENAGGAGGPERSGGRRSATRPCEGSCPRRYSTEATSRSSATAIRSTASPVRPTSPKVKRP